MPDFTPAHPRLSHSTKMWMAGMDTGMTMETQIAGSPHLY